MKVGEDKMKRMHQAILIGSWMPFCWLAMMALHESGHVLAALAKGGAVTKVVLHPLALSRTDLGRNPSPLVIGWAGPAVGVALPLAIWGGCRIARFSGEYLVRFLAGFCAIANGAYLGAGAFTGDGDAGDLMRHGADRWMMVAFGACALPLGLALWHGLGRHFGLGEARGQVDRRIAIWSFALFAVTWGAAMALSPRS